jgi:hypothetical protein
MRRVATFASIAVLAAACATACAGDVTVDRLAGAYVMTKDWNADTLHLYKDGRYTRTFAAPGKPVMTDSGKWFLSRDKKKVGLLNYPKRWAFVHDLMGDTTQGRVLTVPTTVGLWVEHSWNRQPRLAWYPEFGWRYRRVGSGE